MQKKDVKKKGPAETRTRILGFKVQSANQLHHGTHYHLG